MPWRAACGFPRSRAGSHDARRRPRRECPRSRVGPRRLRHRRGPAPLRTAADRHARDLLHAGAGRGAGRSGDPARGPRRRLGPLRTAARHLRRHLRRRRPAAGGDLRERGRRRRPRTRSAVPPEVGARPARGDLSQPGGRGPGPARREPGLQPRRAGGRGRLPASTRCRPRARALRCDPHRYHPHGRARLPRTRPCRGVLGLRRGGAGRPRPGRRHRRRHPCRAGRRVRRSTPSR